MSVAARRIARAVPVEPTEPLAPKRGRLAISPDDLLVFSAVARVGGIRSAATSLSLPKSTVSRQLAALERAVGAKLVTRTSRRFVLTEVGQRLLEQCQQLEAVLAASQRVVEQNAKGPTGLLKVAASPIVGDELLAEPVSEYLSRYPGTQVDVAISPDFVDLRRSGIDLAIRTGPLQSAADLYAVKLATSVKGAFASPAYLAKRGTPAQPHQLVEHDCVVVGNAPPQGWGFTVAGEQVYAKISPRVRVDSYRLARTAATLGAGIARLPQFYAAELVAEGRLVPVLERYAPRLTLFAVHTAGLPPPPKIRAFIELLKRSFRERLEGP